MSPRDAADLQWPLSEGMQVGALPPVWIAMIISCWSVKLLKLPSLTLTHVCGTNSHNWWAKGLPGVGVVTIFYDSDSDSSGWKSFRLLDSDSTALVMNGFVMNVVCFEWSVMNGLFWTGLFWMDTLQNIALQLCIITTAIVLGKTCMFLFFRSFHCPQFFKSPIPYPAPGSRWQIVRCLQMTIRFQSKSRSNMCLKFLVAARRQREMMVIISNAENVKSAE